MEHLHKAEVLRRKVCKDCEERFSLSEVTQQQAARRLTRSKVSGNTLKDMWEWFFSTSSDNCRYLGLSATYACIKPCKQE